MTTCTRRAFLALALAAAAAILQDGDEEEDDGEPPSHEGAKEPQK